MSKDTIYLTFQKSNSEYNFAYSYDGGDTFEYKDILNGNYDPRIISERNGDLFFIDYAKSFVRVYKYNPKTEIEEKLFELRDINNASSGFRDIVDNKLLFWTESNPYGDSNKNVVYITDENFENPKEYFSMQHTNIFREINFTNIRKFNKTQSGKILFNVYNSPNKSREFNTYFILDSLGDSSPDTLATKQNLFFYLNHHKGKIDEGIITIGKFEGDDDFKTYYANLNLENGLEYEIIGETKEKFMQKTLTNDGESYLYVAGVLDIWRPIEEDRLISTVTKQQTETENYVYAMKPYPLPASDRVTVEIYLSESPETIQTSVYNSEGVKIDNGENIEITGGRWPGQLTWECGTQSPGVYYIQIISGDRKHAIPVVVGE